MVEKSPRMFDLFWVQSDDGTWVLDHSNAPPTRPFHVMVREGNVVVEWRMDVEQSPTAPDEARWLATRLMEAAVLADCSLVGLLVEAEVEAHEDVDAEIIDAEIVDEALGADPDYHFDPASQSWRRRSS